MRIPKRAHIETIHEADACNANAPVDGDAPAAAAAAPAILKPRRSVPQQHRRQLLQEAGGDALKPSSPPKQQEQQQEHEGPDNSSSTTTTGVLIDAGLAVSLPPAAIARAQALLSDNTAQRRPHGAPAALLAADELCAGLGQERARVLRLRPLNKQCGAAGVVATAAAWQIPPLPPAAAAEGAASAEVQALLVPRLDGGCCGGDGGGGGSAMLAAAAAAEWHLNVLGQIDAVGWGSVVALSKDLSRLALRVDDDAGRPHVLRVQLPRGFPVAAPAATLDLPERFAFSWARGAGTLSALAAQARAALRRSQRLWECLESLDRGCRVLDALPAPLARRAAELRAWCGSGGGGGDDVGESGGTLLDNDANGGGGGGNGTGGASGWYARRTRRIALPRGAGALELELSPSAPAALPSATFSGGGAAAAELQRRWFAAAAEVWREGLPPADNVAAVLGVDLPPPSRAQLAALDELRRPLPALGGAAEANVNSGGLFGNAGGGAAVGSAAGGPGAAAVDHESSSSDDDGDDANEEGACGICYAVVLPGAACAEGGGGGAGAAAAAAAGPGDVPDTSCDADGGCGRVFHGRCLAEWLRGLADSRRCFATIFGQCPYCSAPVAVRAD